MQADLTVDVEMDYSASMSQFKIYRCPLSERKDALRCLHRGVSTDQQDALVATLEQLRRQDSTVLEGLFVAKDQREILAAAWVQRAEGNTAILWPPDFASPAAAELMQSLDGLLSEWGVPLAQMVIGKDAEVNLELLALAGFHKLVDLDYLSLENPKVDANWPKGVLFFEPHAANQASRLQNLLLQSYDGTLDCPQLNGLRDPADVIASYQAQGVYEGEHWYLVQLDRQDIGILILAKHDNGKVMELVYMGVVPSVRGRSLGEEILRHAIRCSARGRAERLVLAVDPQNAPAQTMYRRAGFAAWDRRTVYARISSKVASPDRSVS
ncbi:GNAT family N-acetyltransferase [Bythopirellula polymerisocia]|uniref:Mycothiol acetyltransferase n=1 Tax=Bythopirellula polymerisocia TaxID=2528003 RepID=A0A5C6CRY5_9BACT|nr:GNAT family N-acetyltransferase [Bythopirellula polymerisocia]TWU27310.1 Mycothiol acetyltransferase [Bythopirellula polymerisocia]